MRRSCRRAALWAEIRKVLNLTEWTDRFGNVSYVVRSYEMSADPQRGLLLGEQRRRRNVTARLPFAVVAPAQLAGSGFALSEDEDLILLARRHGAHLRRIPGRPALPAAGRRSPPGADRSRLRARATTAEPGGHRRRALGGAGVGGTPAARIQLHEPARSRLAIRRGRHAGVPAPRERSLWIVSQWRIRTPALAVSEQSRRGSSARSSDVRIIGGRWVAVRGPAAARRGGAREQPPGRAHAATP